MKFLKFRYIFTLAIVLVVGITLMVYFFGGLKAKALFNDNLEFNYEGFVDFKDFDDKGQMVIPFKDQSEVNGIVASVDPNSYSSYAIDTINNNVIFNIDQSKIVAQNDTYTMFLDENTTVVSVAVNGTCDASNVIEKDGFKQYNVSKCSTVYKSASTDATALPKDKSNFILNYIGTNDKLNGTGFNTYSNSVAYKDLLYNTVKKHYRIKFDAANEAIEILYEVGDFTVINSYFPQAYDRKDFMDAIVGNLIFVVNSGSISKNNELKYSDLAYTFSSECAAYLEEHGATVTPYYTSNPDLDESGNPIPARWNISDILAKDNEGNALNKLKLEAGVDYNSKDFTADGASPCITNPFMNSFTYSDLFDSFYNLISKDENDENITLNADWKVNVSNSSQKFLLKASGAIQFEKMNVYFYDPANMYYSDKNDPIMYDADPNDNIDPAPVLVGGNQERDEQGNFLYNEDGTPKNISLTKESVNLQNEKFGIEVETKSPVFQVGMRFALTDKGLEATILNNSLIEGMGPDYKNPNVANDTLYKHQCRLGDIIVLPNFTANDSLTSQGEIIIPDGSGAIMTFNSPKDDLNYTAYAKPIYGRDKTFTFDKAPDTAFNEKLMFGMYGFLDKTNQKGVLAIVDRGANETSIYANFKREAIKATKNIAYFQSIFRESETVYAGTSQTPFLKWAKKYVNTDFKYVYQFLAPTEFLDLDGNIQYVTLANKYHEYLVEKYNLTPRDETDNNVVTINFLGAYEKRQLTLGFAHNEDYSLTTFDQAEEIIKELQAQGVTNFSVSYTGWTKDAMEPMATRAATVSSVLGKASGLEDFYSFLKENEINLYPEVRVASNKGYDFSFGNLKYTAKSIGSTYAQHREYVLATNMANTTVEPITMISPEFYNNLVTKYLNSYDRLGIEGAYISDLGNLRIGNYTKDNYIYAENGMDYQKDALNVAQTKLNNLMLSAPYDYALPYTKFAINVPLETTLLGYYDYSIPFYQLVVAGLFDYTGPAVNYDSEHSSDWYILKSLETGSNLYFMLSYEDTKALLNTDYTMYFNAYYANWKSEIVRMNNILNSTGIYNVNWLISHKILRDNVYEVEYQNGQKIIINYNNTTYYDAQRGISVRPNWFAMIEEGD